jgi:GTP-binding protein
MYQHVKFMVSAAAPAAFPADSGVEVVFAGRSNCGKSSAINAITGRKSLARTSRTPGRTRLINFFEVEPGVRLVDLPGYGYARVSAAKRDEWGDLISGYFAVRRSLAGVVLIMDCRHPLKDHDWQMIEHARARELPLYVLLSKADKLGRAQGAATVERVRRALGDTAPVQLLSTLSRIGVEDAQAGIERLLRQARPI